MNRTTIQPSPQSRNARKPLLNLTSHYHNSSQEFRKSVENSKPLPTRSEYNIYNHDHLRA